MSSALRFLKTQRTIRIITAAAVVLWMGVIFMLSAQDHVASNKISGVIEDAVIDVTNDDLESKTPYEQRIVRESVYSFVRTSAHFLCFAVLGALSLTALLTYRINQLFKVIISLAFSVLYAVSDEVHQIFVPGRSFEAVDIGFDALGVACGVAVVCSIAYIVSLKRKSRMEKDA